MTGKTEKHFLFTVQLNWLGEKKGILSAHDAVDTIQVATPPEFGGTGKPWSPEHLFLGAISSCFMTTLLAFAEKFQLSIAKIDCDITGLVGIIEGKYKFTKIDVFPRVFIAEEGLRELANKVVTNTHRYCLVTNSVNAAVTYHTEVLLSASPGLNSGQQTRININNTIEA
ncbi:MAG: OsmC family protein [Chitinophagaceae bacterium]